MVHPSNVLDIVSVTSNLNHSAAFPVELPAPLWPTELHPSVCPCILHALLCWTFVWVECGPPLLLHLPLPAYIAFPWLFK